MLRSFENLNFICEVLFTIQDFHKAALQRALACDPSEQA